MFTGLIQELGTIESLEKNPDGIRFQVSCSSALAEELKNDDSVSVNGACQTVIAVSANSFVVQAVHVTLEKTNFKNLQQGSPVNLELAMRLNDRLGGHMVSGHVNGVAKLVEIVPQGTENFELWFELPTHLLPYALPEGSICLDGISLTIARVRENQIMTSIIPHTWNKTNLRERKVGDLVNVEVDLVAKYIEHLLGPYKRHL